MKIPTVVAVVRVLLVVLAVVVVVDDGIGGGATLRRGLRRHRRCCRGRVRVHVRVDDRRVHYYCDVDIHVDVVLLSYQ